MVAGEWFPPVSKPREKGVRREPNDDPGTLTLSSWDRVFQAKAHQYQITSCCLSPDRRLLATVCLGGYLKVTKSDPKP